jgi:hypothetical protein
MADFVSLRILIGSDAMAAATAKKQRPPLNPLMLKWAREWRGHTLEDAARRVNKKPEDIAAWERVVNSQDAVERPTVKQARSLADLYDRAFLEFFRSDPPPIKEPALVPDFRMHRRADKPGEARELKIIQGWAEAQRQNALDLYAELGDQPPMSPASFLWMRKATILFCGLPRVTPMATPCQVARVVGTPSVAGLDVVQVKARLPRP